jgi:hypothetical protein
MGLQGNIPEDGTLHSYNCENLKSRTVYNHVGGHNTPPMVPYLQLEYPKQNILQVGEEIHI